MKKSIYIHSVLLSGIIFILACCRTNPDLKPSEGYIEVNGGRMWYRIIGEGRNNPVVMLHGGPGGTSWYLYPLAKLSDERPVILYDQLGSGKSYCNVDTTLMTVDNYARQLKALISELKLNKFYLYGHSWGTMLGLEYYTKYPEGIKALIFNSPYFDTHTWIKDADTLVSQLPDTVRTIIKHAKENQNYSTPEFRYANHVFYKSYTLRGSVIRTEYDTVRPQSNNRIYEYMWGPSEFVSNGTLKDYDITYQLKGIRVPTLFITGEFDEARPSTVKHFHDLVPGSRFEVIQGAGHSTIHDNLQQNLKVIRDFLQNIEND